MFSAKSQVVITLGHQALSWFVTATQFYQCSTKVAFNEQCIKKKRVWLCSDKSLFTKQAVGGIFPLRLQFANPALE